MHGVTMKFIEAISFLCNLHIPPGPKGLKTNRGLCYTNPLKVLTQLYKHLHLLNICLLLLVRQDVHILRLGW